MPATTAKQLKNLWVIDDDRIYRDVLEGGLRASLKGVKIERFATERQAMDRMDMVEAGESPPDLVIADVMMPYVFPGEGQVPADIAALGDDAFRAAGSRLWRKARGSKSIALRSVPWIYHSVLRQRSMKFDENSDEATFYVGKDQTFDDLIEIERTIFGEIDSRWEEPDEVESNRLQDSITMRGRLLSAMRVPVEQCLSSLE